MNPAKLKLDALAYLLGGVGLLAMSALPLTIIVISEVHPLAKLIAGAYWLLGGLALWWAVRRFTNVGERVVAVMGVVIGWYVLLQLLMLLQAVVFKF